MNTNFLIYCSDGDWQLLDERGNRLNISNELDFQSQLNEVQRALLHDSCRQSEIVVLIGSSECLCVDSLKTNPKKSEQLLFKLEEHLPLDAEQMVLGKGSIPSQLEMVVDREKVGQLLAGLESIGVSVHKVLPATLFVLQLSKVEVKNRVFVVAFFDGIDIITFDEKGLVDWTWYEKKSFSWQFINDEIRLAGKNVLTNVLDGANRYPDIVEKFELSPNIFNACQIRKALRNPWFSFPVQANQLQESNYTKASMIALVATLSLLVFVLNFGLWIAGSRYQSNAIENVAIQQSIVKAVSPKSRKRGNAESYLKSVLAKEEKKQIVIETLYLLDRLEEVVDVLRHMSNPHEIDIRKIGYSPSSITVAGIAISKQVLEVFAEKIKANGYVITRNEDGSYSNSRSRNFSWQISLGEKS